MNISPSRYGAPRGLATEASLGKSDLPLIPEHAAAMPRQEKP